MYKLRIGKEPKLFIPKNDKTPCFITSNDSHTKLTKSGTSETD